ncbi:carbonic anhydrase 4-like [Erythrolamprus reginae]|uniref:carbonic anhydrase 4-like n=1 Tax=Erythrolamprus reginae TaxID=121349 RepID=UPI00396CF02C
MPDRRTKSSPMDFLKILTTLTMVYWLPSECSTVSEASWCYVEPHCGPQSWISLGRCNGKRQSPINIVHRASPRNLALGAMDLVGYDNPKKLLEIQNTGKTVDVTLGDGLHLSGLGLPDVYKAKSFHFHWGDGALKKGSEHQIDGKQYSMEMHIVHTRGNLSMLHAVKYAKGIAVLAFFIEESKHTESKTEHAWGLFTDHLKKVSKKGDNEHLDVSFSLLDLMGTTNFTRYYRYPGSLTTPGCEENVIWTVFADPILLPSKLVNKFTKGLYRDFAEELRLKNNFRPIQKIGVRRVEASNAMKSAAALSVSPPTVFALFLSIATFLPFFSM